MEFLGGVVLVLVLYFLYKTVVGIKAKRVDRNAEEGSNGPRHRYPTDRK